MSLLFNMLSRLIITFLPRSRCLLISWLQSPSAVILEPPKIKSVTISIVSPSICHEVMGPDAMILVFWILRVFFFFSIFFQELLIDWLILLYNTVLVFPYIDLNLTWVYMCSPSWIPLPSPSLSHASGSPQCTSPKHPVSCITPRLAIHFTYDILHVSMLYSHIIPLLPSPTESKRLFNTSLFAVLHTGLSLPSF